MSLDPEFPLSVFRDVLKTIVGWTVVVMTVAALAAGIGLWAGSGQFPLSGGFDLGLAILLLIFYPPVFIVYCTTAIIWLVFLAIEIESTKSRLVALAVLFAIWIAVGFWIGRF
jgi:hypothetical protein